MFDLEAIERRHAAGSPATDDMGDLIAEVKRLSAVKSPATKKPDAKKLEPIHPEGTDADS
jgi:hypothetical protein